MRNRPLISMTVLAAVLALFAGLLASAGAQDATPSAMDGSTPRPAHIHSGACPDVGDVVFPLEDVTGGDMGTPVATPSDMAAMMATPGVGMMQMSVTVVEAPLEDILAAEHAINVHESAEAIDVYIACGDITGEPDDQGMLMIDLEEQNESGFMGQAMLQDNGDGTTTVTLMLQSGDAMATPGS